MGVSVSRIAVYPVKSLGAMYPLEATLEATGLRSDRAWMVVDEDGAARAATVLCRRRSRHRRRLRRLVTVTLSVVKDCIRCEIPTVDQATGEKGVEPMEVVT